MNISVVRERKLGETRVAITPAGVRELVADGHSVFVETEAGALSGFTDEQYTQVGASITSSLEETWGKAELLVKVKEPTSEEVQFFRPDLAVFCFFHLAVIPEVAEALVKQRVVGLDYDLVMTDDGRLPILEPMSVIAGRLSIQAGAYSLQSSSGGSGVLLSGAAGVPAGKVLVIGAGAAGRNAARLANGMSAEVCVLDIKRDRLIPFVDRGYRTQFSTRATLEEELSQADLVIGAVLIPGALAPKLVTRELLGVMKKGSVLVDICIDQGGIAESSQATTIAEPTYLEQGVVHYCVPNMPALVPRTSTQALSSATLPWIRKLADLGVLNAMKDNPPLKRSLVSYGGYLTNETIARELSMKVKMPRELR